VQGHKRSSGVLLVVAGSRSMTGAPALIARAAGRVGAGLVIVATPRDALPVVAAHAIEAVFLPLDQTEAGTVASGALDAVLEAARGADAVAIGPGLSRDDETARLVRDVVARCATPFVLDADGLNAFEGDAGGLGRRPAATVLTPHDGEFARLMLRSATEMPDRVSAARALADASHAVALLKGTRTVIAQPGGPARVNPTGTPALATAGTGDVLTGMIGGLLARGLPGLEAATAGAFVHGLAGQRAGATLGEGVLAADVVERIPEAIASVMA
jgi:NAD(P)H-hydrate epimerase